MKYVSSSHDPPLRTMCSHDGGSRINPCCCVLLLSYSLFFTLRNQQKSFQHSWRSHLLKRCSIGGRGRYSICLEVIRNLLVALKERLVMRNFTSIISARCTKNPSLHQHYSKEYGVVARSALVDAPYCNVTRQIPLDITHVIVEGALSRALYFVLKRFLDISSFALHEVNHFVQHTDIQNWKTNWLKSSCMTWTAFSNLGPNYCENMATEWHIYIFCGTLFWLVSSCVEGFTNYTGNYSHLLW